MILWHAPPSKVQNIFPKRFGWREGSHSMIKKQLQIIMHTHLYHQVHDLTAIKSLCLAFWLGSTSIFPYEIHSIYMRFIPTTVYLATCLARYIPPLIEGYFAAVIYLKHWLTIVTRLPNHWWASSCPTTRATHCLAEDDDWLGSTSKAVSLYVTNPQFSMAPV